MIKTIYTIFISAIFLFFPCFAQSEWSFEEYVSSIVNKPFMPPVTAQIIDTGQFPIKCGVILANGCLINRDYIFIRTKGIPQETVEYTIRHELGHYFDPRLLEYKNIGTTDFHYMERRADAFAEAVQSGTYLQLLREWITAT